MATSSASFFPYLFSSNSRTNPRSLNPILIRQEKFLILAKSCKIWAKTLYRVSSILNLAPYGTNEELRLQAASNNGYFLDREQSWKKIFTCAMKKGDKGKGCDYFEWHNPIMCRRSTTLIPGLPRSMNSKNATIERLRARERKLLLAIFLLVLLLLIVLLV